MTDYSFEKFAEKLDEIMLNFGFISEATEYKPRGISAIRYHFNVYKLTVIVHENEMNDCQFLTVYTNNPGGDTQRINYEGFENTLLEIAKFVKQDPVDTMRNCDKKIDEYRQLSNSATQIWKNI